MGIVRPGDTGMHALLGLHDPPPSRREQYILWAAAGAIFGALIAIGLIVYGVRF